MLQKIVVDGWPRDKTLEAIMGDFVDVDDIYGHAVSPGAIKLMGAV